MLRKTGLALRSLPRLFQPQSHRRRTWSSLSVTDKAVRIESLNTSFPYVWLRDACPTIGVSIHPTTSQKLARTTDVPLDIKPATPPRITDDGFAIDWPGAGNTSFYPRAFLEQHASPKKLAAFHRDVVERPWDGETVAQANNLFVSYSDLKNPVGLLKAITQLSEYGLLFISGVPNANTSNDTCELAKVATYFGQIRETFYGLLWDVKNVENSANVAYTDLDLGLHMDLLYCERPPRMQFLHCLRNRVIGGHSYFVDALHVASTLRETHPSDFDVLTTVPVPFHYINDGHHLHYEHPTIELGNANKITSSGSGQRPIDHVNYSPPFQAPLLLSTPPEFYSAFSRFTDLLDDPKNVYGYTMREGDCVVFDNLRVLHARTAFRNRGPREAVGVNDSESELDGFEGKWTGEVTEGDANRWLKGCYMEADTLLDKGRILRAKLAK